MSSALGARRPDAASVNQRGTATLDGLAHAARQVGLYGPGHRVTQEALEAACRLLREATVDGRLVISAQPDGLLWNGDLLETRIGNVSRFHAAMRERVISNLEFGAQVKPEDLGRLLDVLSRDAQDLVLQGGAVEAFGQGSDSSIRIEQVDFANEILVSETAWRQLRETMASEDTAGLSEVIASCARSLRGPGGDKQPDHRPVDDLADEALGHGPAEQVVATGLARLVQQAGEAAHAKGANAWREWREQMAAQLAALSPRWRAGLFRAPTGGSRDCPDMLSVIASEMAPSDCVSLVLDHPDSIRAERSAGLAVALERIMAAPERKHEVEVLLHEEALSRGVPEEVYQNVVGLLISGEGQTTVTKASSVRPGRTEWEAAPADRLESRADLDDLLLTSREEAVRRSRLHMLEEVLGAGLTARQYGTVMSLLLKATEECAAGGDAAGLLSVLSALGKEAKRDPGKESSRRAVAASALARSGSEEVVSCIAQDLEGSPEEHRRRIIGLLGMLGEPGMRALGEIVSSGDAPDFTHAVHVMLANDLSGLPHVRDLLSRVSLSRAKRMLRVLIQAEREGDPAQLSAALDDAPEAVRLALIGKIREAGQARLATVLIRWVSDAPCAVRLAAIRTLGELRVAEAAPALLEVVSLESNFGEGALLKEAAAKALAAAGATSAIPRLCEMIEGGAILSMIGSPRPRIAAAMALGRLGGPDARHALEQGCRSVHGAVRRACQHSLERLRARENAGRGRAGHGR
jgi:HEAT repeat protein